VAEIPAFITWPSVRTLYLTCTLALDDLDARDFNSVYLLTRPGPPTEPMCWPRSASAICGSTQLDLSMASIVCALAAGAPLVYFIMKRLSR